MALKQEVMIIRGCYKNTAEVKRALNLNPNTKFGSLMFTKHSELHGEMEELARQKKLIPTLKEPKNIDYRQFEQSIQNGMIEFFNEASNKDTPHLLSIPKNKRLKTPYGEMLFKINHIKPAEMDGQDLKHVSISMEYPKEITEGRLGAAHLLLLTKDDVITLNEKIKSHLKGAYHFPKCDGVNFGQTDKDDWGKLNTFFDTLLSVPGFLDDHMVCYTCSW